MKSSNYYCNTTKAQKEAKAKMLIGNEGWWGEEVSSHWGGVTWAGYGGGWGYPSGFKVFQLCAYKQNILSPVMWVQLCAILLTSATSGRLLRIETKSILNPENNSPEERERHRHCPLRPSQMFSAPTVPFVSQAQGLAIPSKFLKKPMAHLSHRGPVKPSRHTQIPGGDRTGTRRGRGRDGDGAGTRRGRGRDETGQGRDGDGARTGTGQGRVITNASGNRVIRESL